jgi:hypothetical protein
VEVYKSETKEVMNRFLHRRLKFPDCISALDAALAGLIPRLYAEQHDELRTVMLTNNEIVMKEMEKRSAQIEKQRVKRRLDAKAHSERGNGPQPA